MLVKLIRFIRGYIVFSVSGSYPERFINLINRGGINYWDFLPDKKKYSGKMLLSDYKNIRKTARKASVKLKAEKRVGFPFIVKKYKRRKGIAVGAMIAVLIMVILSQFVWDVKLNGVERLSENEVYTALSDCGLKAGAFKSAVDFEAVERKLVLKVPEIRWVSINALNSIAEVEIKEKQSEPKLKKGKYPCNLVASDDGVITDTLVSGGTCKVKRGSAVVKNQLLVSTVVEGTNEMQDKLSYAHSDGKIFADVIEKKSYSMPIEKDVLIPEKNYTQKGRISFLWFSFPAELNSGDNEIVSEVFSIERLRFNNVTLPVGADKARFYGFNKTPIKRKISEIKFLLKKKAVLSEAFNFGKYKLKSNEYSFKEINDGLKLSAFYTVNKNIAVKQRVKVE